MDFINYDTNTHQYIPERNTGGYNERLLRQIKKRQELRNN